VRRQAAAVDKVVLDFLRHEPDGTTEFDKGQSFVTQVKYRFETDAEMLGNVLGRPQVGILDRGFDFPGSRGSPEITGIGWRVHKLENGGIIDKDSGLLFVFCPDFGKSRCKEETC
jgi:hypothetical protein